MFTQKKKYSDRTQKLCPLLKKKWNLKRFGTLSILLPQCGVYVSFLGNAKKAPVLKTQIIFYDTSGVLIRLSDELHKKSVDAMENQNVFIRGPYKKSI